jgi:demethylmenaquinone methyltransferase/2-methoxy-6-polyprenyl-1,4-benzoquinol methylase
MAQRLREAPAERQRGRAMSRADLDKDPHDVAAMFDGVARRYDLTNTVLTAVSTVELRRSGAWCVAADFSLGMLRAGAHRPVPKVAADALHLPFRDGAFDAVTISFGLRNVADPDVALAELARVTRPGGRLVVCEFGRPTVAPFRAAYYAGLEHVLPAIARRVSSNPEAYVYLGESIRDWPAQPELAARIAKAGWADVAWRNLALGAVALHRAVRPGA